MTTRELAEQLGRREDFLHKVIRRIGLRPEIETVDIPRRFCPACKRMTGGGRTRRFRLTPEDVETIKSELRAAQVRHSENSVRTIKKTKPWLHNDPVARTEKIKKALPLALAATRRKRRFRYER